MNDLLIQSYKGTYRVRFGSLFEGLGNGLLPTQHLIIDEKVADLYSGPLNKALSGPSVLKINATEENKSLEKMTEYINHLLEHGIRRNHQLVAIGGGIIQDIVAFIGACLLRGVGWKYYPTTLLAQADSCIGSKSSINVGKYKNQVGTFTPPDEIQISMEVLDTLTEKEMRSGIGEIIKVHVISGLNDVKVLSKDFPRLLTDKSVLAQAIHRSLKIKKVKIEIDEFDQKERLIMNYGHTFGHAIESATHYAIPHGIAVTLGMDIANYISFKNNLINKDVLELLHGLNVQNYSGYQDVPVPLDAFFGALNKDKKNIANEISMILLKGPGQVYLQRMPKGEDLQNMCIEAFDYIKEKVSV